MKTIAIVLAMLGSVTAAQAHAAYGAERNALLRAGSFSALQDGRIGSPAPGNGLYDCNGGPCSLTGGPSGGPNQT